MGLIDRLQFWKKTAPSPTPRMDELLEDVKAKYQPAYAWSRERFTRWASDKALTTAEREYVLQTFDPHFELGQAGTCPDCGAAGWVLQRWGYYPCPEAKFYDTQWWQLIGAPRMQDNVEYEPVADSPVIVVTRS